MTPSTWPVFPVCPTFGISSQADYSVTVVERAGGVRTVNRNWYFALNTYTAVPMGERPEADIDRVQRFWHAVGGRSGRILFDDFADNHTASTPEGTPAATDMPMTPDEDSPSRWQLLKTYTELSVTPALIQSRLIQKPRSIAVAVNGITLTEGIGYTVDYDWGLVNFASPPALTDDVTWGGYFYVPVMFESTPEIVLSNRKIRQTGVSLRELRLPRVV